jgi:imidazole glycerol phosphate synthase subunit HisF
MLRPRISPCLLIHKGGLVKTQGFTNPKYVGDPLNAVRIFNEKEVDEIIVVDIASPITLWSSALPPSAACPSASAEEFDRSARSSDS